MSIINGSAMQGATRGFYPKTIEGSLRFNDDDSAYLSWTPSTTPTSDKKFTFSFWIKLGNIGTDFHVVKHNEASNVNQIDIHKQSNNTLNIVFRKTGTSTKSAQLVTNQVFRDPSAWYHIVVSFDSTAGTPFCYLYVNGSQVTSLSTNTQPSANDQVPIFASGKTFDIGRDQFDTDEYMDGYLAEVFFIDGTAHNADAFGETKNGVWVPKNITATDFTMGTNGFHLTFQDDAEVEAFNAVLWRGDGATKQSITGMGFQPDLVWVKQRSSGNSHILFDAVRGFGSGNGLQSQNTAAEGTNDPSYGFVSSADADGFTVNEGTVGDDYVNTSGQTYVSWGWDAGANNAVTGHSSVTWTGNGGTQAISGLPFRPDLVWIKNRDNADNHYLFDIVRGAFNGLNSDTTSAEVNSSNDLSSFNSDGFSIGSDGGMNRSGQAYVGWAWDAGDGDPVSNTDGSITSTVKASTTNGFSIVSYTGTGANATVGHGLSSAPDWVLVKDRDNANDWIVWHSGLADGTQHLKLNATENSQPNATYWNSTVPSSSVISLGNNSKTNGSSQKFIAYCFHDVTGKQKFGTYTGTGASLDITLGFRAGWVMIKRTDSTDNWYMFDSSRDPFGMTNSLYADVSSSEGESSGRTVTVDSDSMTLGTNSAINANGATYIYAAFAGSYSDYITDYNEDGSIDSRVKANDTTGFSIVSTDNHTGSETVGHGLNQAPDWIVAKARNGALLWPVYHSALGSTKRLRLNDTTAAETNAVWGNTDPTTSVFTFYQSSNTYDYIFYCWAEKTGYSKFGTYTGNGSTSGPSITCGFKPAMIILKRTDSGGSWTISDNTRDTVNPVTPYLFPHASDAEATDSSNEIDFNSNGFQIKHDTRNNTSGATYIYAAFADTREAAFWLDQSGNDNDWQPVNLDHNDTLLDSPTDNFATWNPLIPSTGTFADGNLSVTTTVDEATSGTTLPSAGKHYCEIICTSATTIANARLGVTNADGIGTPLGANTNTWAYLADGRVYHNSSASSYGTTLAVGDVFQIALDIDAGKVWYGINGTFMASGDPTAGTNPSQTFTANQQMTFAVASGSGTFTFVANFGQQPFKYDPPA